jgi:hypothetical protein
MNKPSPVGCTRTVKAIEELKKDGGSYGGTSNDVDKDSVNLLGQLLRSGRDLPDFIDFLNHLKGKGPAPSQDLGNARARAQNIGELPLPNDFAIWSTTPQEVELGHHQHVACLDGDYFSMIQTPFHTSAGGSA